MRLSKTTVKPPEIMWTLVSCDELVQLVRGFYA
jgi:hypothetical protein